MESSVPHSAGDSTHSPARQVLAGRWEHIDHSKGAKCEAAVTALQDFFLLSINLQIIAEETLDSFAMFV